VSVCLDAFALLAWLQDEPEADKVEKFIERASREEDFVCYISTINLGEVFYRLLREKGMQEAESFWEDVIRKSIPLRLIEPTRARVREAARIKGEHPIAYADAFAIQAARENGVALVTGDPEMKTLENAGYVSFIWLNKTAQRSKQRFDGKGRRG
jgi:predicted nucleic acid-binding protein